MMQPFENIKKILNNEIPGFLIDSLPCKWEKIGDVLILKLDEELLRYQDVIGRVYSSVLKCRTVLNDIGGVSGEFREPNVEVVYGCKDTETIHKENGIHFKLDPQKVMFSSGNMDERIRMANISRRDEVVVDLFAGIGYFSIPMAVYSKPKKIFACEKNPVAYDYLCQNIVLNNVVDIVEPVFGDNKKVAPRGVADRVIMGYIDGTEGFLTVAFDSLRNNTGFIHFHEKYSEKIVPGALMQVVQKVAVRYNKKVYLLKYRKVKSYAPGIGHFVFDLFVDEK